MSDTRIMPIAVAQSLAAAMSCTVWDGTSPVNGCTPEIIRREYQTTGAIYLLTDGTGQASVIQHHAPGAEGHQSMTPAQAAQHGAAHLAQIREQILAQPLAQLRGIREPLLAAADIAINKATDRGQDPAPMRAYRDELRNITAGLDDPAAVVWPVLPA
jgi:hypothetical protein